MSVALRPYQLECLAAIKKARQRGINRMLIVSATGTGKTTVFCELARLLAKRNRRTLILVHRDELIEQAGRRIEQQAEGLSVGIEAAQRRSPTDADVVIASVASVGRKGCPRLAGHDFGLVVTDEAHHAAADTYGRVYEATGIYQGKAMHIGVTATPHRLDNKPLHGGDAIFEEIAFEYSIRRGIKEGYLCPIRAFRVETTTDLSGVRKTAGDYAPGQLEDAVNTELRNALALEYWREVAADRQTIVFCAGVDHSHRVAELFRESGIKAASVVGETDLDLRREAIGAFRSRKLQVLINVNVLTEGFDAPETNCIFLLRPTQSWALYAQMVGRGLRTTPGKEDCAVIDVCDITTRHSLAHAPGLLGLPSYAASQEGRDLVQVLDSVEAFEQGRPVPPASRLVSIQLLANMELPDFFEKAALGWGPAPGGRFSISLADQGERRRVRAELAIDAIGTFWLAIRDSNGIFFKQHFRGDPTWCVAQAETVISEAFEGAMGLASRDAAWRFMPASDKQIAVLMDNGLDLETAQSLTRGQATRFISLLFASR